MGRDPLVPYGGCRSPLARRMAVLLAFLGLLEIPRCHGWIRIELLVRTHPRRGPGVTVSVPFRPPTPWDLEAIARQEIKTSS